MNYFKQIPIFHMASMARSGETLILRTLEAHPQIHISHNLNQVDTKKEAKSYKFFKNFKKKSIRANHPIINNIKLSKNSIIIVKQGTWKHKHPFDGFILSRNPASIYASLRTYDTDELGSNLDKNWLQNEKRLIKWLKDIDPKLIDNLLEKKPIEQFCMFYNLRMRNLYKTGLPIIYYEKFVTNPKRELKKILSILNTTYDESILLSHNKYSKKDIGHGKNRLDMPINSSSIEKYKSILTKNEFDIIAELTRDTSEYYFKYNMKWDDISIS